MIKIDYLSLSLGTPINGWFDTTEQIHRVFAEILPKQYKATCRDMVCSGGRSQRVNQYGICVMLQYGSAISQGWMFCVQLSGQYWEAINREHNAVLLLLNQFKSWQMSRLDLACDVCVPTVDWQGFYKGAFNANEYAMQGKADARTIYYGSRKSQIYTRVYNKSANDPEHYPAPKGMTQIRLEIEIHKVRGELILEKAFRNPEFANKLFLQRVRHIIPKDATGFINQYFNNESTVEKVKTVGRVSGDFKSTVDYVIKTYGHYIEAAMKSEKIKAKYKDNYNSPKTRKILAVLEGTSSEEITKEDLV
jgi:DNA relaxase NicK